MDVHSFSLLLALSHLGTADTNQLHQLCLSHVKLRQAQNILEQLSVQRLINAIPRSFVINGQPRRHSTCYTLTPLGFEQIKGHPSAPAKIQDQFNRIYERSLDMNAIILSLIRASMGFDVTGFVLRYRPSILLQHRFRADALLSIVFNEYEDDPPLAQVEWLSEPSRDYREPANFVLHLADDMKAAQVKQLLALYASEEAHEWFARFSNTPFVVFIADDAAQRRRLERAWDRRKQSSVAFVSRAMIHVGDWGPMLGNFPQVCRVARWG